MSPPTAPSASSSSPSSSALAPPSAVLSPSVHWHAISPHTRPLLLTILELTPLALTLSLSLAPPRPPPPHLSSSSQTHQSIHSSSTTPGSNSASGSVTGSTPVLATHLVHSQHSHGHQAQHHTHPHSSHHHSSSHGHSNPNAHRRKRKVKRGDHTDDEEQATGAGGAGGDDDDPSTSTSISPGPSSYHSYLDESASATFKDLLSNGVVVSVNGQSWKRIVAHVSEDPGTSGDVSGATSGGEDGGSGDDAEDDWEDDEHDAGQEEAGMSKGHHPSGLAVAGTRRRKMGASAGTSGGEAIGSGNIVVTPAKEDRVRRKKLRERGRWGKDKAIVVVYDLDPGREYEIELRVVGMTTDFGDALVLVPPSPSPASSLHPRSRANSLRSRSRPRSRSNSLTAHPPSPLGDSRMLHYPGTSNSAAISTSTSTSLSTPSATPNTLGGATLGSTISASELPIPTNILSPVDVQTAQVRHALAAAHAEKEHMQLRIKEARRNAQRGEAALRAEIEAAKRASEKAGSTDLRAKQKTLALQEQVKQGWAGAENADKEAVEVEAGLPELEKRLERLHGETDSVRSQWKAVKEREEDVRETDKKSRSEEEKRLAEVVAKLDKLKAKKEKKEAERFELEKRLEELEREREEAERRGEEERMRRAGVYFGMGAGVNLRGGPGGVGTHGSGARWDEHAYDQPHLASHRTLSAHSSLNNLSHGYSSGGAGANGNHRPRGNYRHPGGGSGGGGGGGRHASQPSPTHTSGFYPVTHPIPPVSQQVPFRPPKQSQQPGTSTASSIGSGNKLVPPSTTLGSSVNPNSTTSAVSTARTVSVGANPAAIPFHPGGIIPDTSTSSGSAGSGTGVGAEGTSAQHTTLMPPQMQHRIYLPSMRPRSNQAQSQTTNQSQSHSQIQAQIQNQTQTQGSYLDAQQGSTTTSTSSTSFSTSPGVTSSPSGPSLSPRLKAEHPPNLSPPAFPPLPGSTGTTPSTQPPSGPSLASIVTRAVLSPTSALAPHNMARASTISSPQSLTEANGTSSPTSLSPTQLTHGLSSTSATGPTTTSVPSPTHSSPKPYAHLPSPTSSTSGLGSTSPHAPAQRVTFAPPPDKDFPISSAAGPWAVAGRNVAIPARPGTGTSGTGVVGLVGPGRRNSESTSNSPESAEN